MGAQLDNATGILLTLQRNAGTSGTYPLVVDRDLVIRQRQQPHSSMLVHPSHTQDLHARYASWVANILTTWKEVLITDGELRDEVLQTYVRPAFYDLVPGGDETLFGHVAAALPQVVTVVQQRVVNSGTAADSSIDWDHHPFWVLVGGNKLDRGYTVEGLVTTYMPRGTGGGQAGTVQQRARFFGYKAAYADLCRAWLTPSAVESYLRYAEHEEALRAALTELQQSGDSLKQWRRKMLLDAKLKPCRVGVIGLPYIRARVRGDVFTGLARIAALGSDKVNRNKNLVTSLVAGHGRTRVDDDRDPRSKDRTAVFRLPLRTLVDELLEPWQRDDIEASYLNGVLLLLGARLNERPELEADVYLMRDLLPRQRAHDGVSVNNLFEGYRPDLHEGDFPGDRAFRTNANDVVSVQIHQVDLINVQRQSKRLGCPHSRSGFPRAWRRMSSWVLHDQRVVTSRVRVASGTGARLGYERRPGHWFPALPARPSGEQHACSPHSAGPSAVAADQAAPVEPCSAAARARHIDGRRAGRPRRRGGGLSRGGGRPSATLLSGSPSFLSSCSGRTRHPLGSVRPCSGSCSCSSLRPAHEAASSACGENCS